MKNNLIRHSIINDPNIIIDALKSNSKSITLNGVVVSLSGIKLKTFTKGITCVHCNRVGKFFAIEKYKQHSSAGWHLNLYLKTKRGAEVLMTSDHIVAKINGGSNSLENRQPMCTVCNLIKGSHSSMEEAVIVRLANSKRRKEKAISSISKQIEFVRCKIESNDTSKDWNSMLKYYENKEIY